MKKIILINTIFLVVFNVYAGAAELTDEYIELRNNLLAESRKPFDKCNKEAKYALYQKIFEECTSPDTSRPADKRCDDIEQYVIETRKGDIDASAHCNILKPKKEQFLKQLNKAAYDKKISKYKE